MLAFIQNSKESIDNFQLKKLVGADMYRWNLKLLRHKPDFVFMSFPCIRKPIIFSMLQKTMFFVLFSSFIMEQLRNKIIIQYSTFVEFCKNRFAMQPLQIHRYVLAPIGQHPVMPFHGWKIFVKI
jgi:hypothetical protein